MGQVHRSTPGTSSVPPTSEPIPRLRLTIPTLRVTAKTNVLVQVYRTVANGTVYYQISNFNPRRLRSTNQTTADYGDVG